jgi:hypothetical protein
MEAPKPRLDQSVPRPEGARALTEAEKRALELSDEVDHEDGKRKEQKAREAEKLAG